MDEVDRNNLVIEIMRNIKKYDDEGRRCDLTAEETVEYAKKLSDYIESNDKSEDK